MPPDVCFNDLKFIIEFVYRGEIDVSQAELQVRLSFYIKSLLPPFLVSEIEPFVTESSQDSRPIKDKRSV